MSKRSRSREKLAELRRRLDWLLTATHCDHNAKIRRLQPGERDLAALVEARLGAAKQALEEGDAEVAFLAGIDAAEKLYGLETFPFTKAKTAQEVKELTQPHASEEGRRKRAENYQKRNDALTLEAQRRWVLGGRKPRDAQRIAKALHREGYDSRSIETLRKIIAPQLR